MKNQTNIHKESNLYALVLFVDKINRKKLRLFLSNNLITQRLYVSEDEIFSYQSRRQKDTNSSCIQTSHFFFFGIRYLIKNNSLLK